MIILVSDTSILIDLERGNLLEAAFASGLTMVVPDLLYSRELEPENGPFLRKLGLGVVALTSDELAYAQSVKAQRKSLSLPDCFALSCATRDNHILVTGDGALRREAQERLGQVFGLLWLLEQMNASKTISPAELHEGLTLISTHPRCRLPTSSVHEKLAMWAAQESPSHHRPSKINATEL